MHNKSIYEINEERNKEVIQYIEQMKIIMIKGIGYFVISKNTKLTPDMLLHVATIMEEQNIKEI